VSALFSLDPLQDEIPSSEAYEHSELLLYKAQVLAEGGQQDAALALLDAEQVRGFEEGEGAGAGIEYGWLPAASSECVPPHCSWQCHRPHHHTQTAG
jgi:hypothetical protein